MLDNQTLEQLRRLRLSGMAAAFAQQLEQPELQALSFEERFSLLLDRELNLRENRRLNRLLQLARLRQSACVEDIDYTHRRGLERSLMAALITCDWIRAHHTPTGQAIASAVSALGSARMIVFLGLSGVAFLIGLRRWLFLEGWVIAVIGGEALNIWLKRLVQRPRPLHSAILSSQSWSFPSGHAMESLIGYGMLAYVLFVFVPSAPRWRVSIALGATLLILLIGWSRIYLGVHYVSDVVGGYAAGLIWLAACISGLEVARRWRARVNVASD